MCTRNPRSFFESNAIYVKLLLYQKKKKNASGAVTIFPVQ